MPPEPLQVVALGLIQGATELLPVSSSAHIAAVPQLLRWSVADWPPERRKELEVALHAGALLALAPALWRARPDARTLALSLAPPVIAGYALEGRSRDASAARAAWRPGLMLGAAALARRRPPRPAFEFSSRTPRARLEGTVALGSRSGSRRPRRCGPACRGPGATLAAARALGYSRADASRLSFGVAGPVLAGATALKAWRGAQATRT